MNIIGNTYQVDTAIWGISHPLWEEMSGVLWGRRDVKMGVGRREEAGMFIFGYEREYKL